MIFGGRSSGARVACRTAPALGAAGVLALAFPLHPPGKPEKSRAAELPVDLPTLVVNGDRDPFGVPEPGGGVEVAVRPGAVHDLRRTCPAPRPSWRSAWLRRARLGVAETGNARRPCRAVTPPGGCTSEGVTRGASRNRMRGRDRLQASAGAGASALARVARRRDLAATPSVSVSTPAVFEAADGALPVSSARRSRGDCG